MVVVRVVVSVTDVLLCLCFRDDCGSAVCSAVSVGAGSDVAVLDWQTCSGEVLS